MANPNSRGQSFHEVRVGQLSLCSQLLLLPLGVPPKSAPAMLHTKPFSRPRSLEGTGHMACSTMRPLVVTVAVGLLKQEGGGGVEERSRMRRAREEKACGTDGSQRKGQEGQTSQAMARRAGRGKGCGTDVLGKKGAGRGTGRMEEADEEKRRTPEEESSRKGAERHEHAAANVGGRTRGGARG